MTLCLQCRDFVRDDALARCPACGGALVEDTPAHRALLVDLLVFARVGGMVDQWRAEDIVKAGSARRLQAWVAQREAELAAMIPAPPPPIEAPPEEPAPVAEPPVAAPPAAPRRDDHEDHVRDDHVHDDNDASPAASVFASADVAHGALDAFVGFDAPKAAAESDGPSRWETEVRPLLYENIGWFIGTLFVLAGSVYGVREAWRSLGGVPRHLIVAAAFMAYHAGFAGIARLLASRSAATGRVLGGIAIGLLPVVFVALSSLAALHLPVGVAASVACAALATWTLRGVARRFESPGALASSVVPVLLAQVPLASLAPSSWGRVLLGAVGVAAVARAGSLSFPDDHAPPAEQTPPLHPPVAALYVTAALVVFALTGASDGGSDLVRLSAGFSFVVAATAATVATLAGRQSARRAFPRGADVTEVLALGGLSIATLSAATAAQRSFQLTTPGLVAAAASLLAAATFARASRRHAGALHFVLPAATVAAWLATCALAPRPERVWPAGTILAACAGLFAARSLDAAADARARKVVLRWSVAIGAALVLCALVVDASVAGPNVWAMSALTAAVFGASAHLAGAWSLRALHLVAAPSLVLALAAYGRSAGWWADAGAAWVGSLAAAGLVYGAAALPYESVAARRGTAARFEVMDDLSRLSLLGAFAWAFVALRPVPGAFPFVNSALPDRAPTLWLAAAGASLLARSLRDRSRYVGLAGALALGYAAHLASGAFAVAHRALVVGSLTLVAAVVATALGHVDRTRGTMGGVEARRLFGGMPLPGASTGVVLVRDAFADAAVVGYALGAAPIALWITRWDALSRPWALQGGALLVASCVVAFLSPGFVDRPARGATATLFAAGAAVTLTAVANRIGRPLAPQVIGLRLTLIAAALWGLRQLAERYGPRVAAWLDPTAKGTRYKAVFSAGVVALACVMVADAALVGAPDLDRALLVTPPLLLLGAALALALMARGTRWSGYWFPAAALVVPGAAIAAAQRGAMGLALEAVTLGTTRWVPSGSAAAAAQGRWRDPVALMVTPEAIDGVRARAVTGVAIVSLLFALTAAFIERSGESAPRRLAPLLGEESVEHARGLRGALVLWSAVGGVAVLATSWWRGNLPASALVALAGVALVGARSRRAGVAGAVLGAMATVHALALTAPQIQWWAGVAWMALAVAILHAGPVVARRYELDPEEVYERTHPLALAVGAAALVYALATGGAWTGASAGADVLWNAFTGLGGRWMASPSLPLSLLLAAWCAGAAASQWETDGDDDAAWRTAAGAVLLAAVATWTGMIGGYVVTHATVSEGAWTLPFARGWLALRTLGTPLSFASALVAGAAHAVGRVPSRGDRGRTGGARWGRDAMLVAAVGWAAVFAGLASRGAAAAPSWALEVGIAGFCAGVLVAGHAAWAEGTARHVYFIQTAIVAVYGSFERSSRATSRPRPTRCSGWWWASSWWA